MPIPSPAVVAITVPPEPSAVQVLRSMAQSMAPPGFDIDRLDDLALAVGEAAVELLGIGGATRLAMTVDRDGERLDITLTVDGPDRAGWTERWESSLSASVLEALVDEVGADIDTEGPAVRFAFGERPRRRRQA